MERDEAQRRVGAEVQRRRAAGRLDQAALASRAKVDPKTVRSLEKGDRWPREASRHKIEQALEWPIGTLDQLLSEAVKNKEFDTTLPSATQVVSPDREYDSLFGMMAHPARMNVIPQGRLVPYAKVANLVDEARRVYIALEDIANGDDPAVIVADAARLHAAATQVAFEWAGGADGFGDLAQTMPEMAKEISRSPDAALELLKKIRARNARGN